MIRARRNGVAILVGALIAAVSLAGALWLHNTPFGGYSGPGLDLLGASGGGSSGQLRASWQDPLSVLIAVAGLGLAAAVLSFVRRDRDAVPGKAS
jgi:hypothetical protein